ncbi:DUF4314 domain-containing protein [Dactylosporangium sp. CA-152071]|uniref:DUF4314 domain-containing protein n=1 Tax=Dactylosporangium sp. CA-152071 TaxID=3239933 RepID=UPI003D89CF82
MAYFRPGDRVELVSTTDVLTKLRPGDRGVVTRFDLERQMVYIDWDGGSKLSMCLDAGDEIRTIQSVTMNDSAVDAERLDPRNGRIGQAEDADPSPLHPHATEDAGALLQRLDRTGLDADDLISLAWIVDRVDRRASLERVEGNLSSVGRVVGAVIRDGEVTSESPSARAAYLHVQLEPSGDRVLWPLDDLIAAQQQECLFELT